MAKTVHYIIPFQSRKGTDYEVHIYKEGTPSSVQTLKGAPAVITTDESANEDLFEPIRTQTGTVSVIYEPSDTYPTVDTFMAAILPASNTDSYVTLVDKTSGSSIIKWQGFLSSDVYNQRYVSLAQAIDLPVISMLEAMDSVQITTSAVSGMMTILEVIKKVLNQTAATTGFYPCWSFYVPTKNQGGNILTKYIDTTALFEQKEYTNENSTTYIVSGLSCLEILRRICKYMGWTCRELGTDLFFTCVGQADLACYTRPNTVFPNKLDTTWVLQQDNIDQETYSMSEALVYTGNSHDTSMAQGAKSVEVVARVDTERFSLNLPDFPYGDVTRIEWLAIKYQSSDSKYFYSLLNKNNDAYSNIEYGYYSGSLTRTGDSEYSATFLGVSTKQAFMDREYLHPHTNQPTLYQNPLQSGAVFIKYAIEDSQTTEHNMETGLYCPLLPGCHGNDAPIFKMWTPRKHSFNQGKLVISAVMLFNALWRYNNLSQQIMSDNISDEYINCEGEWLDLVLKVGDKYWDGDQWTTTRTLFQARMKDTGLDVKIPVEEYMSGQVTLEVLAGTTVGNHVNTLYEVIFKTLEVYFEYNTDYQVSDRNTNHYFRLLGTNFRDEISVDVDFASSLNNAPSPSLIMEDVETAMTELDYSSDSTQDLHRPEVVLLDRLATYYSLPRRTVKLEVEHPKESIVGPLSALELTGYDGKTYLPMAESRDWQNDSGTLTCLEKP